MSPGLQDTKYRSVMLRHFQMVPPGATGWCHLVPIFNTNLPCVKEYLHTNFHADISNGFWIINRTSFGTSFSDGATWCHRVVPPGAHFQYQPTLCQGVPTYQVSCRYLKRFSNYWSDVVCYVIFRWCHLLPIFNTNLPCVKEYLPTKFHADISNSFRVIFVKKKIFKYHMYFY